MNFPRRERTEEPEQAKTTARAAGRTVRRGTESQREGPGLPDRSNVWKDSLLRRMLAGADIGVVLAAGGAAALADRHGIATTIWAAALLPLWIVAAKLHGLYDNDQARIRHLTLDELPSLLRWVTVSVALTALVLVLTPSPLSAGAAVTMWAVALGTAVLLRWAARAAWRRLVPRERGLLIGEGPLADAFARKLVLEPGHHLALVASLPGRAERLGQSPLGSANPRRLAELEAAIARDGVERVVLAAPDLDEPTLAGVLSTCRSLRVKLSVAPPLRATLGTAVRLSHLAELPLIEFRTWDPSRSTMLLKRTIDVTLAGAGLLLLSPLMLVIPLLIRLDSPGPALFRQHRAGLGDAGFTLFKFRTMVRDAEERLESLVRLDELEEPMFKLRSDPRVTRVGRLLRRTSLDELPQLINVVRGDMSLVGPRPEEARLVARYDEDLRFRLQMRPGITGPMQVHGRAELTFQERVAVEREYVENYSLGKDLRLLLQTAAAVTRRRGAY